MLAVMCLVPVAIIVWLALTLPPVMQTPLACTIQLIDVPPSNYYKIRHQERPTFPLATILLTNESDDAWTHINVRLNRKYSLYQYDEPLEPGQTRAYPLGEFLTREGARLQVSHVQIYHVEVYARLPTGKRGVYHNYLDR